MVLCIAENNYLSYFKLFIQNVHEWTSMWTTEIFIFRNGVMHET